MLQVLMDQLSLQTELLGALPIVNEFMARCRIDELLAFHLDVEDPRIRVQASTVLGLIIRNLVVSHEPLYELGDWARRFDPEALGLSPSDVDFLNDDRIGRVLDRLFEAERASLLTDIVLQAIRAFGVDCSQLHNDSTSVTLTGSYKTGVKRRGGSEAATITFGHNKDHRPDLRQLVWILTVSADGAIPVAHRVVSGNITDDVTHVQSWDELASLAGNTDFLYVADCKLATRQNMEHIDSAGGRFVSIMPRTRREDTWFRDWVTRNTPSWVEVKRTPSKRSGLPDEVFAAFESPLGSSEGYRIIWVQSSIKKVNDAVARSARIERAERKLSELNEKLAGPKCRLRNRQAVMQAAEIILEETSTTKFFETSITQTRDMNYTASHAGRAGTQTTFRQDVKAKYRLNWKLRNHVVRDAAASDGCFPLITNDEKMTPGAVLDAYKYQPNLERRHHQLKSGQAVAPVFLKSPVRIEALLSCHFIALLLKALIEREIRSSMKKNKTKTIALYPEERDCGAPSVERVMKIFDGVSRHHLLDGEELTHTFDPDFTGLQRQVLRLLGINPRVYRFG